MAHSSAHSRPFAPTATTARVAAMLSRPRPIALACIAVLASAGWAYLLLGGAVQASAGSSVFFEVICRALPPGVAGDLNTSAIVGAMWLAMTLAMMLPTAGPMILTYADIAETALRKGERIVSPLVLTAGYLVVWFGFSLAAASAQLGMMTLAASLDAWRGSARIAVPASAVLFLVAGLYQFSALKASCLHACQRPFSFFFLNWTDRTSGVFRLGLRQGLYCLGCCWAMMFLMFATGAMNIAWMALLGVVMTVEKMTASRHFSRAIGIALLAAGFAILAAWQSGLVS